MLTTLQCEQYFNMTIYDSFNTLIKLIIMCSLMCCYSKDECHFVNYHGCVVVDEWLDVFDCVCVAYGIWYGLTIMDWLWDYVLIVGVLALCIYVCICLYCRSSRRCL